MDQANHNPSQDEWPERLTQYPGLPDRLSDDIVAIHADGRIRDVWGNLAGMKASKVKGRHLSLFLPDFIRDSFQSALDRVNQSREFMSLSVTEGESGVPMRILTIVPSSDITADTATLVILHDLSFRRTMRKKIAELEKNYRSVFESANDSILITDPVSHLILEANRRACEMLGYLDTEMRLLTVEDITPHDHLQTVKEARRHLTREGHTIFETEQLRRSGKTVPVEVSSRRIQYQGKTVYLNVVRDLSERRKAKELLFRKNEELHAFIYRASHDLKGPLATIRGLLDVAMMETGESASRYYFELIRRAAQRLDRNLTDFIQVATLSNVSVKPSTVDLNELVAEVVHEATAETQPVQFDLDVEVRGISRIVTDRKLLRSLLLNLVTNAVKYGGNGHRRWVGITTEVKNRKIWFEVADNGKGIPPDMQEVIFDMFVRADRSVAGNGLGLSIVKGSVQRLGGEIQIDSTPQNGTTFRFWIPVLSPAPADTVPAV